MSITLSRGSAKFLYGIQSPNQLEEIIGRPDPIIGLAFVGRSNVGKSSLINSLFGKKTARTSKTPGRTREVNIFQFDLLHDNKPFEHLPMFLFDLPGYGHAEVSKDMAKNWNNLMDTFFKYIGRRVLIINLQDSRHPNQKVDQMFKKFLNDYGVRALLAFNKIDKLKRQKERAALNKLKPQIYQDYKDVKEIHFISAEAKTGVPQLEQSLVNFLLHEQELILREEEESAK